MDEYKPVEKNCDAVVCNNCNAVIYDNRCLEGKMESSDGKVTTFAWCLNCYIGLLNPRLSFHTTTKSP